MTTKKKPAKKPAKKKAVKKKPMKKKAVTNKNVKEATDQIKEFAKRKGKPVRVQRADEDLVDLEGVKNAAGVIDRLEDELKDLKNDPTVQRLKHELQMALEEERNKGQPVFRGGVPLEAAYGKKILEDMRRDAGNPNLNYKAHMPFIGSDRCNTLNEDELRAVAHKMDEKEERQKNAARSFVSYYKKVLSLKNNHIKMLNEEVDVLRRKNQLLEARLNENEDAVEELLVVKSLKGVSDGVDKK